MKMQDHRDENREKINWTKSMLMKKKHNKKRLGGAGLSLEAFANAKSKNCSYNPALINKQREYYKNAKYVSKYKKSLKQQNRQQNHPSTATIIPEESIEAGGVRKINKKNKNNNYQSLKDLYENKLKEEEKARKEKEAMIKAKKEERERVEAQRKIEKEKMFKKTRSGQPIMKYRIEHILKSIQGSASG